jgi:gluconokinase
MTEPTIVLVMGASGAGKTSVGAALARRLGWGFLDADDLHPAASIEKMRAGEPLTDAERAPWLAAVRDWINRRQTAAVVACSALKRRYRDRLRKDRPAMRLVYLKGDEALIAGRLEARRGHYWPASLLASQFVDLEPPSADEAPITVDIDRPLEEIVEEIMAKLGPDIGG